jgi:ABC-2 type transport system ATP-binding protein
MIKANALTKHYGSLVAVDSISFQVQPGEVLGFLGPNGAGKSTTMRMFAGFVPPTSGSAEICGYSIENQPTEAKRLIGYLPEGAPTYGEMTPRTFLAFIAQIRGLSRTATAKRTTDVIERLNLGPVLDQSIETLSKGFKRRVGIAQAILHDPPVLIMDEPTDGLDPNQKHEVRQLIQSMAADKIIVISTHILEEVAAVCNRAIIIAQGRIVADETPTSLIHRSRFHNAVTLKLDPAVDLEPITTTLRELNGVEHVETNDKVRTVTAFPAADASLLKDISDLAAKKEWPLEQLKLESGRLDEVFRTITTSGGATSGPIGGDAS